ncbi:MAG: PilZ domain-containing protein [Nitrospiraceae bacterium]|nr:MAG: PilZ domain-containing protein [Nitrospiraceae bacterium]
MLSDEKRRALRVAKRLEVKFNSSVENTAITNDLSENGMFIATCKGMDPGKTIDIKLQLPSSKALLIKGKVIRNIKTAPGRSEKAPKGMGVELISPPADYIDYIQSLT